MEEATGDSESDVTLLSDAAYDSDGAESSSEGGGGTGEKRRCVTRSWWLQAQQVAAEYRAGETEIIGREAPNDLEPASTTTTPAERPTEPRTEQEQEDSNHRFWEACLAHGYP